MLALSSLAHLFHFIATPLICLEEFAFTANFCNKVPKAFDSLNFNTCCISIVDFLNSVQVFSNMLKQFLPRGDFIILNHCRALGLGA